MEQKSHLSVSVSELHVFKLYVNFSKAQSLLASVSRVLPSVFCQSPTFLFVQRIAKCLPVYRELYGLKIIYDNQN